MRTFGAMALGGLAGIVILKLLAAMVFPLFGIAFGLMATMVKVAMWVAIGYFVYTLLRGRRRQTTDG